MIEIIIHIELGLVFYFGEMGFKVGFDIHGHHPRCEGQ